MSNEPINGNETTTASPGIEQPTPQLAGVAIARVPITLAEGETTFAVDLRGPAIVRGATFWLYTPKVLASAMRGVRPVPMPLLFVECVAGAEMVKRTFSFLPSDALLNVKEGFEAKFVATALMHTEHGPMSAHLFEIVKAPS